MPMERDAWAKVNLTLRIAGRTAEGYHLLQSLVVFAEVGDRVALEPVPDLGPDETDLQIFGPYAQDLLAQSESTPPSNLVLRAVEILRRATGLRDGLRVALVKNLPVAAGIGGGSADAAATLHGLRDLWNLKIDDDTLCEMALPLGADLPVCLLGRPSLVGGIGEVLTPLRALPKTWLVLANAGVPLSTAAVFQAFEGSFGQDEPIAAAPDLHSLTTWLRDSANDLELPALRLCPVIGNVLQALAASENCLLARMSGSGGTCFGLFDDGEAARHAARCLGKEHSDWWVKVAPVRSSYCCS